MINVILFRVGGVEVNLRTERRLKSIPSKLARRGIRQGSDAATNGVIFLPVSSRCYGPPPAYPSLIDFLPRLMILSPRRSTAHEIQSSLCSFQDHVYKVEQCDSSSFFSSFCSSFVFLLAFLLFRKSSPFPIFFISSPSSPSSRSSFLLPPLLPFPHALPLLLNLHLLPFISFASSSCSL